MKVLALSDLPPSKGVLVSVNGHNVGVYRRGAEVLALGDDCPHQGGSLCDGWVEGEIVICPLHGWEFDIRTGACMTVPGESVPRYTAIVEDGAVYLEEVE